MPRVTRAGVLAGKAKRRRLNPPSHARVNQPDVRGYRVVRKCLFVCERSRLVGTYRMPT